MSTKMERWKKLSGSSAESTRNLNKGKLIETLASIPEVEITSEPEVENVVPTQKEEQVALIQDEKTAPPEKPEVVKEEIKTPPAKPIQETREEPVVAAKAKSTSPVAELTDEPVDRKGVEEMVNEVPPALTEATPASRNISTLENNSLINKVSGNVRHKIQTKQTKEETHKKTTLFMTYENLAKLELFDRAHGGRIKGEFINNLLEEAFAELEEDPRWARLLNSDLDLIIQNLKMSNKQRISNFFEN